MKIGIFTDAHYSSREVSCGCRYNNLSLRKTREAYEFFAAEGCDCVIFLGDLTDTEDSHAKELQNLREICALISSYPLPTYCLMGNHDAFVFEKEEFYAVTGFSAPEVVRAGDANLLFLDACFFTSGRHYAPGDDDWTDTFLPNIRELEKRLAELDGDTYIFIHQNIDPAVHESHRLSNWRETFDIIKSSGKVRAVYQGHYHGGCTSEYDGIKYITLPAMCEREGAYFTFDV
ncbi:MAG: hypothetical protein E7589_08210 [Ruminococcaceae bacterium]|nr:hypothetical protein [Oscillospiraceae bacterium]